MPLDRVSRPACVSLAIRMAGERLRLCVGWCFAALLRHPPSSWFKTCRRTCSLDSAELSIRPPCVSGWRSIGSFG